MCKKRYIYNWQQSYFYMENGVMPIERPGINPTTEKIYFVFNNEETKEVYDKWVNRNK